LTRRAKPEKVYREIDLPLLLLFSGLFIVVHGLEKAVFTPEVLGWVKHWNLENVAVLSALSAALSNLVSNVPAVLVLKPFLQQLTEHRERAWLTLAMSSTLAGNFTIVGSVANLIVVERARKQGVTITFYDYFRVGAPLTIATLVAGVAWLALR
jgi:Na+/H+ antiporter NhaD/arsenite permease-like protein